MKTPSPKAAPDAATERPGKTVASSRTRKSFTSGSEDDLAVGDRLEDLALQRRAEQPRVGRAGAEVIPRDAPRRLEVDDDEVRGRADRDARRLEAVYPRRPRAHPLQHDLERDDARLDQLGVQGGEGRLEPGDPERRFLERHFLLIGRVRSVVGGDRADRPVPKRVDQRVTVAPRHAGAGSSSGWDRGSGSPRR